MKRLFLFVLIGISSAALSRATPIPSLPGSLLGGSIDWTSNGQPGYNRETDAGNFAVHFMYGMEDFGGAYAIGGINTEGYCGHYNTRRPIACDFNMTASVDEPILHPSGVVVGSKAYSGATKNAFTTSLVFEEFMLPPIIAGSYSMDVPFTYSFDWLVRDSDGSKLSYVNGNAGGMAHLIFGSDFVLSSASFSLASASDADADLTGTPEPISMVLVGSGLLGCALLKRRKRKA